MYIYIILYLSSCYIVCWTTLAIIIYMYTQPVLLTCDSNGRHRDVVGIAETGSGKFFQKTNLVHCCKLKFVSTDSKCVKC